MRFLAVKNWEKFQHYKDRSPPWIKFYAETLDDLAFILLPEPAQAQLMKLWLFASKCNNCIPYDRRIISQAIKAGPRLYLREIMSAGFVYELHQTNASTNASADASADASAESPPGLATDAADASPSRGRTRAREEDRGQRAETAAAAAARERGRTERDRLLSVLSATRRDAMRAALDMYAQGNDLPPGTGIPTAEHIEAACRDIVATCEPASISPKVFRKFLLRAMRPETDPAPRNGGGYLESELARLNAS